MKVTPKDLEALNDLDICLECGKKIKGGGVALEEFEGEIVRLHAACAPKPETPVKPDQFGERDLPGFFLLPL